MAKKTKRYAVVVRTGKVPEEYEEILELKLSDAWRVSPHHFENIEHFIGFKFDGSAMTEGTFCKKESFTRPCKEKPELSRLHVRLLDSKESFFQTPLSCFRDVFPNRVVYRLMDMDSEEYISLVEKMVSETKETTIG